MPLSLGLFFFFFRVRGAHSWQDLGNHMWCRGLNWVYLVPYLLHYLWLPASFPEKKKKSLGATPIPCQNLPFLRKQTECIPIALETIACPSWPHLCHWEALQMCGLCAFKCNLNMSLKMSQILGPCFVLEMLGAQARKVWVYVTEPPCLILILLSFSFGAWWLLQPAAIGPET